MGIYRKLLEGFSRIGSKRRGIAEDDLNRRQCHETLLAGALGVMWPARQGAARDVRSEMTELDHGGTATAVAQRSSPAEQLATYYRHVLFDNSLTPDRCFYSRGTVSPPSFLRLDAGKLPVDTEIFFTPPNALRLEWTSAPNGGWEATVLVETWRNRELQFEGDTLYFWCYTPDALARSPLPRLM